MRTLLSNRDATDLAQVRRFIVGTLSTDQAENIGETIYVDGTAGSDAFDGKSPDRAKATIAGGLAVAAAYDVVAVFPGTYAEHVTMAVANVSLVGLGDTPWQVLLFSAANVATPMVSITASNCVVTNLRVSLGHANNVVGIQIAASSCVVQGCEFVRVGAVALDQAVALVGPNTNTYNTIQGCLFRGHTIGIQFVTSATAQAGAQILGNTFEAGVTADINDGGAAVDVTLVLIDSNIFAGIPTDFIVLTAGTSTGMVSNNTFASATHAAATITVDAGVLCVCNHTVAGISAAAPA